MARQIQRIVVVAAGAAINLIARIATDKCVAVIATRQDIRAGAAVDHIIAGIAGHHIIAVASHNGIVTGFAGFAIGGHIKINIGDVDTGCVRTLLVMGDFQPGNRTRDVYQSREVGIGVLAMCVLDAGFDEFVAAHTVKVLRRQARPDRGVDCHLVASRVIGFDRHLGIIVDVIDTEGDIFHIRVKGQLINRAFALCVQLGRKRGMRVDWCAIIGDGMHFLFVVGKCGGRGVV